jgi:DNA (cytosine-5)-methyltransferase 1
MTAISLFSSGGIGDLALGSAGFEILVSNEILEDRHALFAFNFPETTLITGDIRKHIDRIENRTRSRLKEDDLVLLYATPPCQGMSKNGRGKLLNAIRAGRRPPLDERNRLIVPTMELACRLRPEIVLFENVPEMRDTLILDERGDPIGIIDFVKKRLGPEYRGRAEIVEFADYGVPQCRQRLITVFGRNRRLADWFEKYGTFMPPRTHSSDGRAGTSRWVTVRNAIEEFPPLDAADKDSAVSRIPYHRVPLLDPMKYWWVKNTPAEKSAFDNQCVRCGYTRNRNHSARRDRNGINRASHSTPLYCEKCGEMLPRPSVERDGRRELMRGYTSAYKRMSYDRPASALTRNLSYACSDNKLHPEQNRVLSLREAFRIHTVDRYVYRWERPDGKKPSDKTVREVIGESIPPAGLQAIIDHLVDIYRGRESKQAMFGPLFHPRSPPSENPASRAG